MQRKEPLRQGIQSKEYLNKLKYDDFIRSQNQQSHQRQANMQRMNSRTTLPQPPTIISLQNPRSPQNQGNIRNEERLPPPQSSLQNQNLIVPVIRPQQATSLRQLPHSNVEQNESQGNLGEKISKEVEKQMQQLRAEIRTIIQSEMRELRKEIKEEIQQEILVIRNEIQQEIKVIRNQIRALQQEVVEIRNEIRALQQERKQRR